MLLMLLLLLLLFGMPLLLVVWCLMAVVGGVVLKMHAGEMRARCGQRCTHAAGNTAPISRNPRLPVALGGSAWCCLYFFFFCS